MNRTMAAQSPDCADGAWSGSLQGRARRKVVLSSLISRARWKICWHFFDQSKTIFHDEMTMHPTCSVFAFVVSQISIHFHFDHSLSDKFCTVSSLTSSLHPLWVTAFILPGIWRWHSQPLSGCSRHHQLIRWYAVLSLGVTMSRRVTARRNKMAKM